MISLALLAWATVAGASPTIPEAARLHAERVHAGELIAPGQLLHLRWQLHASGNLTEMEDFIGVSRERVVVRAQGLAQPYWVTEYVGGKLFKKDRLGHIQALAGEDLRVAEIRHDIASEAWSRDAAGLRQTSASAAGTTLELTTIGGVKASLVIDLEGNLRETRVSRARSAPEIIVYDDFYADAPKNPNSMRDGPFTKLFGAPTLPHRLTASGSATYSAELLLAEVIEERSLPPLAWGPAWRWRATSTASACPCHPSGY